MLRHCFLLMPLLALAGCTTLAPEYVRPEAPVPNAWATVPAELVAEAAAGLPWRDFFVSPQLRQIVALALENNRDQRIALLNIERTRSQYRIRRAELLPQLDASASGSIGRVPADLSTSGEAQTVRQFSVGIGVSAYELDLFGRIRSLSAQALEQYLAGAEAKRAVQISLVSQVAAGWLNLAADREQLKLARETLANQQAAYRLIETRFRSGVASALDLQQAETRVAAARVDIARFTSLVAQDENALQLLVGIPLDTELLPTALPESVAVVTALSPGLPSEVLLQRPDILQAEHELLGANANIGAARAAFFPRIALVSSIGTGSDQLDGLFHSGSLAWNFAPGITLPLFNAGSNRANLEVAKLDREVAVARYEQAIQAAFREVADALARQATIDAQLAAQLSLSDASAESYRLSDARYQQGVDSYLNVLDAQRTLYAARQQLIETRLTRLTNLVTLYKVVGGGSS